MRLSTSFLCHLGFVLWSCEREDAGRGADELEGIGGEGRGDVVKNMEWEEAGLGLGGIASSWFKNTADGSQTGC
jgi:hypothetical protein